MTCGRLRTFTQPTAKLKVPVELENDIGETKTIEAYDEYLTWNHIDVGSIWEETVGTNEDTSY